MEEIKEVQNVEVVDIQFRPGQKVYFFSPAGLKLRPEDPVIIDTARGPEYGVVTAGNHMVREKDVVMPLRQVLRLATERDRRIVAENREKEARACRICQEKIAEQGLDMQLVGAECAFDGSKILFFFTADERVDFRELVKNLASTFHTRIELRQIGVRDKAKMVGGLGICGRPFCCASFLEDFQPVSIKMAKTQNLSLNPTKISGTCGRLMCCLKYEQETYEDLIRSAPKAESFVDTPQGRGTVVDVDLLRQRVKVRLEDQPDTVVTAANEEIAVLRSGKAKKNDPPIPADLAPISGGGKRPLKQDTEEPVHLDGIRLRYSNDVIAESLQETAQPTEESAPAQERPANRRRRRPKSGKKPAPGGEASAPQEKSAPTEEKAAGERGKPTAFRRRDFRRRRPPKKQET